MKKLWIKLSIFLVAVVALPMFIPGPDGRPIMSLDDWIPSDLISGAGETLGHLSGVVGSKGVLEFGESTNEDNIYTWRDEHGGIHYGDKPVEGAVVAELSEPNVTHAVKPRKSLTDPPKRGTTGGHEGFKPLDGLMQGDLGASSDVLQQLPEMMKHIRASA